MSDIAAEKGIVVGLEGDFARIQLIETDACESCSAKMMCKPGKDGSKELLVSNEIGADLGQQVTIGETGHLMLKLALMQFGLPLLGLLIGALAASGLQSPFGLPAELFQAICGFSLMALFGGVTHVWAKSESQRDTPVFKILGRNG